MSKKLTVKLATQLREEIDSRLRLSHVKRDSFLDHLINCELPHLDADLKGKRLSMKVRRYIARSLKRMGTTQVNVALHEETAERLNDIVERSNLVRDSLINRILYFSLGTDSLLNHLNVPLCDGAPSDMSLPLPTSYLSALQLIQTDPLRSLRRNVAKRHGVGLYIAELPEEMAAFACYLDEVPASFKYATGSCRVDSF